MYVIILNTHYIWPQFPIKSCTSEFENSPYTYLQMFRVFLQFLEFRL